MRKIVVIGGGAAGMLSAVRAAERGNRVILLEQNEKLGKKIYITGKGRCNITNDCDVEDFIDNVFEGRDFSYSCMYTFTPQMMVECLNKNGLKTKVERGNRVFPLSDKASDVTKTLRRMLEKNGVEIMLQTKAESILTEGDTVSGVRTQNGVIACDGVILCTGGKSYPSTGSTGDGYRMAEQLGHTIEPLSPGLVGFVSGDSWVRGLSGLSLLNVNVSYYEKNRYICSKFGEMLFTHKGISGPVILSLSCVSKVFKDSYVLVDLKPALSEEVLEKRMLRDFEKMRNKHVKSCLDLLMPKSLAKEVLRLSKIAMDKKINQITVEERKTLLHLIKNLKIRINGLLGFEEAIITRGGINLREINPSTMESKKIKGLYIAGETLALHGFTGGYNLQLAFSTGFLAGDSIG